MSQDQIKILIQILNVLHFHLKDAKVILPILEYLNKQVAEPLIDVPIVTISPENIYIDIEDKKK